MRTYDTVDKAAMAALFFRDQHQRGLRDKAAKAASAGIRLKFLRALEASDFLDDPIVTAARGACGSSAGERRLRRNEGPSCSVKLPLIESMIATRRASSWTGMSWDYPDIDQRAVYLATVWAFDLGARVSEYTAAGKGSEDHCVRAGDLMFEFESDSTSVRARGGEGHFESLRRGGQVEGRVLGCLVKAVTHKTGECRKTMLIGRRHETESQLLEDLVEWITHAGIGPNDELFSRYAIVGGEMSHKRLWPKQMRDAVKVISDAAGMDPKYFSAHSLRKGSQTHMSALGASLDDRRARWNYSASSQMPVTTYDYSSAGHGALPSNSLGKGSAPGIRDIQRYLPIGAAHLGSMGGGGTQ